MPDDLGWELMAGIGDGLHTSALPRIVPTRPPYRDKAQPDPTRQPPMTTPATMPACYSARESAQPGIITTAELHHRLGVRHAKLTSAYE
jgi:hypothetical protein